jgi:hypothetical protein
MTADEQAERIIEILETLESANREELGEFIALASKIAALPVA